MGVWIVTEKLPDVRCLVGSYCPTAATDRDLPRDTLRLCSGGRWSFLRAGAKMASG